MTWLIWLVAAVVLLTAEVMVEASFFLAPFGIGALGGAIADLAGAPTGISIAVFAVITAGAFVGIRPIARRHMKAPPLSRTGTAALIGQGATVIERVTRDGGTAKIDGEVWTARPYLEDLVLEPGARAHVVEIRGATALLSE